MVINSAEVLVMSLAVSDLAPQPAFQKGPGWPRKVHVSRVSFRTRFFFRKKKQAKRSDGLCVHHLFRLVQRHQRHTQARVMSLPLMEQLKARFALQEMCKMLREVFESETVVIQSRITHLG